MRLMRVKRSACGLAMLFAVPALCSAGPLPLRKPQCTLCCAPPPPCGPCSACVLHDICCSPEVHPPLPPELHAPSRQGTDLRAWPCVAAWLSPCTFEYVAVAVLPCLYTTFCA